MKTPLNQFRGGMQNLLGLFNGHRLKNAHKVFVVCQLFTGHVVYVSALDKKCQIYLGVHVVEIS